MKKKLDPKVAQIITELLAIIAEDYDDEMYSDDFLADHCGNVFSPVSEAAQLLMKNDYEVSYDVLGLLARFIRAAGEEHIDRSGG